MSSRKPVATTSGFKPPDEVDTADDIPTMPDHAEEEDPVADDDTESAFSSLEQHLFGQKHFDREGEPVESHDLTTVVHRRPSDADTVLQRSSTSPPPVQVVTVLPDGVRPTDTPPSAEPSARTRPQGGLIAAGGVFAGMSLFAAGAFLAVAAVVTVAVLTMSRKPEIAPLPPIGSAAPLAPGTAAPGTATAPIPPELVEGVRFPATFGFDDWRVQNLDGDALDALVEAVRACPGTVRVTGHTDARGDESINDRMAVVRASEVRRILEAHGIERSRIEVGSAGSGMPTTAEDTPEARALNRRVTVRCDPISRDGRTPLP